MPNAALKELVKRARVTVPMSGSDEEKCFCVELVERSENAADLSWVFNLPEMEEASYGEGDLYQDVGEVIVDQLAGRRLSGVAIQATR